MLLMFFCVVSEIKIHNKMYSFLDFNVHLWCPIYGGLCDGFKVNEIGQAHVFNYPICQ